MADEVGYRLTLAGSRWPLNEHALTLAKLLDNPALVIVGKEWKVDRLVFGLCAFAAFCARIAIAGGRPIFEMLDQPLEPERHFSAVLKLVDDLPVRQQSTSACALPENQGRGSSPAAFSGARSRE